MSNTEEIVRQLGELRYAAENAPNTFMRMYERVVSEAKDRTLVEQAVYMMGNVVEKLPYRGYEAEELMKKTVENPKVAAVDREDGSLIGAALKDLGKKLVRTNPLLKDRVDGDNRVYQSNILAAHGREQEKMSAKEPEKAPVKNEDLSSNRSQKSGVVRTFDIGKLPVLALAPDAGAKAARVDLKQMRDVFEGMRAGEKLEIGREPSTGKNIRIPESFSAVSRKHCTIEKMPDGRLSMTDTSTNGIGIVTRLDKDNLPKLSLAPNAGENALVLDLKAYQKMLDSLQPGEEIAIGRDPKGKNTIAIPPQYGFVSRQHCSIRKTPDGGFEMIDTSTNGTDVIRAAENGRQQAASRVPPNIPPQQGAKQAGANQSAPSKDRLPPEPPSPPSPSVQAAASARPVQKGLQQQLNQVYARKQQASAMQRSAVAQRMGKAGR